MKIKVMMIIIKITEMRITCEYSQQEREGKNRHKKN